MSRHRLARRSALLLPLLLLTSHALAAPKIGEDVPGARAEDVDGRPFKLDDQRGKTVVIVYEDKESGAVNKAFKDDLTKLATRAVVIAPVADLSEFNSWPAKGFAKDAIRAESKKSGITIWCDWDASFRKALDLPKGSSSVVVVGKSGKVLFAVDGALDEGQRKAAIAMIEKDAG